MMRYLVAALAVTFVVLTSAGSRTQANDLIVEKNTFALPRYTTVAGDTIKSVQVGWEAAGTLNADKSNAILVTHFFSGTSHAFGKYSSQDQAAEYWDAIIGPGKAIDTNKYYVLSSDTLVNLNANMPNVVTTGPASINPDTGKPYGMSFPVVSIKDFVRVQKALVDSLGIKKLKAVIGASMGALQAYEWAQSYPDSVERIVAVVGYATPEPYLIAWLDMWAQPIRLDPKWNNGDYYGREPPIELAAVDPAKIKAPALVLYAPNDLVFYEPIVRETVQKITEAGGSVEGAPLPGPNGHLNSLFAIGQANDKITAFLAR
jgi:homoserine O-acetyltransferase